MGMGLGMMGRRRRWGWGWGGGWGRRRGFGGHGGGGCGPLVMILLVIVLIIILINASQGPGQQYAPDMPVSTNIREPLNPSGALTVVPMYTNGGNLNWIQNRSLMVPGLNRFFEATGVRPHIYVTDEIPGSEGMTLSQLNTFLPTALYEYTQELYDRLFDGNEYHLLLVFFENHQGNNHLWRMEFAVGHRAQAVIDHEAIDILSGYIFHFYDQAGITPETLFSNAFDRTATRIMARPADNRPVWMTFIIVAGAVLLIFILFSWWNRKKAQQNLEAEQTERILGQSLDTFGTEDYEDK